MKTTTLAKAQGKAPTGKEQVKDLLEQNKESIARSLPKHVTPDRMLRCALTAYTTTPGLKNCYIPSLIGGIVQCATMGLEPNTPLGHAYLIPFKNKKMQRTDVQVVIGYTGLIDLMRRSGDVASINAGVAREGDLFEFEYGLNEKLRHIPVDGEFSSINYFYAYAVMKDGGKQFVVMPRSEVDRIMGKTQSGGKYGPWKDNYEEMGKKTAIRRLAKYMPKSIELATAVQMDEAGDDQRTQSLETALKGEYTIEQEVEQDALPDPFDAGYGNNKDVTGLLWDAKIHQTSKDGGPVWCDSGEFAKRRARKPVAKEEVKAVEGEVIKKEETPDSYEVTLENFKLILKSSEDDSEDECESLIPNVPFADRGIARKLLKKRFSREEDNQPPINIPGDMIE